MPELPEVEVVLQGLASLLIDRKIERVHTSGLRLRQPIPVADLVHWGVGSRVTELRRRGKYLIITLDNAARLVFHLGMTGRLGLFPAGSSSVRHDHLCLALDNQMEMRFNDTRRFGCIQVLTPGHDEGRFFSHLGPEPLLGNFSATHLRDMAVKRRQPVKMLLMDNRVVVGIGNIYANEILHEAEVSPFRPSCEVSDTEWEVIVEKTRQVLTRAIAAGGSTIADFINASGKPGYFQLEFTVYGRGGQPCLRCSSRIEKMVMAGRATYSCPGCQK
ncbi:MAG: bifunctional DNA-formamidopyrimidine glycosylase/DNA-(apurinic or apyrimidinic site) lyase [Proteobacteria bacterium]|nr:bifunctional DNA-formamidopyrimidine glycosylase/DNA-(apurinic or apyrimidinic site) lyase [Pseudomonadota bacterium]